MSTLFAARPAYANNVFALLVTFSLMMAMPEVLANQGQGLGRLPAANHQFSTPSQLKVELGRNLMFDKVLSGNRATQCPTGIQSW